jgi:formate dehydrogenase subunit gamma
VIPHTTWSEETAKDVIARHSGKEGPLLPILHDMQHTFGYIPEAALPLIADALNLGRAEVYGVATFYHDFRMEPPGRHTLKLCRAEACQSMGGRALAEQARAKLGVDWGGTTSDGAVTLQEAYCLGLCACAPAAMVDGEIAGRLDRAELDRLLAEVSR